MAHVIKDGKTKYKIDYNGFLLKPSQWNGNWVNLIAKENSIIMTEAHNQVINRLRQVGKSNGYRFKLKSIYFFAGVSENKLHTLFKSPKIACKIAGCLPLASSCNS